MFCCIVLCIWVCIGIGVVIGIDIGMLLYGILFYGILFLLYCIALHCGMLFFSFHFIFLMCCVVLYYVSVGIDGGIGFCVNIGI